MDELLTALGLHFEDLNLDDEYEAETLSYFITSHLERFPMAGEELLIPLQSLDEQEQKKYLHFKVLWVKKSIVGEIDAAVIIR